MGVILILMLASLGVALLFLGAFIWAVRSGQFEDTFTPSMRILTDEASPRPGDTKTAPAKATKDFPQTADRRTGKSQSNDGNRK